MSPTSLGISYYVDASTYPGNDLSSHRRARLRIFIYAESSIYQSLHIGRLAALLTPIGHPARTQAHRSARAPLSRLDHTLPP
jgi:hypothetical protein